VIDPDLTWQVNFPEDFQAARGAALVDKPKVLLSAIRFSDGPWCVKTALDPVGVAVVNSVHMVAPKQEDDDSLYAAFAFACSGFFNCWIDEHSVGVNIPTRATRSVPIPFGDGFTSAFSELGREIAGASSTGSESLDVLLLRLEETVWAGLQQIPQAQEICSKRLAGRPATEGTARYKTPNPKPEVDSVDLRRFGYVMDVKEGELRLWINGLTSDEGSVISTPHRMPGWLLRPGATFDVTGYGNGLETARYVLQAFSYENFETPPQSATQ